MRRRTSAGQEVGIDVLLAGSDAFGYLADELAAEYARRYDAGDRPELLEWARRLAEVAGWWWGRLEAEADHVAGFDSNANSALGGGRLTPAAEAETEVGSERRTTSCHRNRRRRR